MQQQYSSHLAAQKASNILKSKFYKGQNLDVQDKVGKWINGQVLGYDQQKDTVYIHYSGWAPKYDEVLPATSERILKQWQRLKGQELVINNRIDAYHPIGGWLQARVIQLAGDQEQKNTQNVEKLEAKKQNSMSKIKAHFFGYHPKYDIWVDVNDRNQVAVIGQRSKGAGVGQRKRKIKTKNKVLSEIARSTPQFMYARNLQREALKDVRVIGLKQSCHEKYRGRWKLPFQINF